MMLEIVLWKEVLVFCTGADKIPPVGFDCNPLLIFLDNNPPVCCLQLQHVLLNYGCPLAARPMKVSRRPLHWV